MRLHTVGFLVLTALVALALPVRSAFGQSDAAPTLNAEGRISYTPGDGAVPIDPDLTISGDSDARLDGAFVSINDGFRMTQDTLGISDQEGTAGTVGDLAWSYDAAGGTLTFTGEATLASYEAALRQVTFSYSSAAPMRVDRHVSISLGSAAYFADNGHFYEFVSSPRLSWTDAKVAADAMTYGDMQGYLATITSASENEFATTRVMIDNGWIGASDADHDKEWYWETGPEAGTHFFTQATDEEGCGQGRADEQPPGNYYENWDTGETPEPNDWPTGCTDEENYGNIFETGLWNDLPEDGADGAFGYLVEYGGIEGPPTDRLVGTIVVQAEEPSITIENTRVGDAPDEVGTFTIIPEVDGCTEEQTVSIPADEASVEVAVKEQADETACTYAVTASEPPGYTVSPDEVTGVEVEGAAAFTTTADPLEALPMTGSVNDGLVVLGLVLAGSGWFLIGGGRRRWFDGSIDKPDPIDLLPDNAWTEQPVTPSIPTAAAATDAAAEPKPNRSAFADGVAALEPDFETERPPAAGSTADDAVKVEPAEVDGPEAVSEPKDVGAHGILEDLLQLMDDLAED